MKRKSLLLVPMALAIVALAGCADSEHSDRTTTLNLGMRTEPESLDAHKTESTQAADILRDIGEGLLSYTATGELTAGAAERWEVEDDGLTYTFYLRKNAKWSNGDAVIAAHFEYGVRRLVAPETAAPYAQYLADIASVTAVDEYTLVITLQRPTPYFTSLLTHPATFPMHPRSIEEHGERFARPGNLLSNGAYVLTEWVAGSVLTLQRNEHYWNNDATAIDEVRHHIVTQAGTELARYRAGEIDITTSVPPDSFAQVRAELGEQLHVTPALGVYYYGFNLAKPPFKGNLELRQALSMAIDRELIVEKVTGRGEPVAYGWVPPGVANYTAGALRYAKLSQEERNQRARERYRAAGYSEENPLQLELRYHTSDIEKKVALTVQSMWREVLGVQTTLINEEFQVLLANIADRELTQVFRSSWLGDYNDAHTFLNLLQSQNPGNAPGYRSTAYDELMALAAEQSDLDKRRALLERAERIMLAEQPVMPIYFYVSNHLVSPRVSGWGDNVLNYHYSQHLSLEAAE